MLLLRYNFGWEIWAWKVVGISISTCFGLAAAFSVSMYLISTLIRIGSYCRMLIAAKRLFKMIVVKKDIIYKDNGNISEILKVMQKKYIVQLMLVVILRLTFCFCFSIFFSAFQSRNILRAFYFKTDFVTLQIHSIYHSCAFCFDWTILK